MADIFDKIVAGEIPSYKVYEDDDVLAFLDISQVTPGHTLMVPKQHIADIFAYDEELAERVLTKLPKIARAIKASNPDIIGVNILSNNGEAAGQSVFHSHWHILPRYADDHVKIPTGDNSADYTPEQYVAIADNIIAHLED